MPGPVPRIAMTAAALLAAAPFCCAETLTEALRAALAISPTLDAQLAHQQQTRESISKARMDYLPTLTLHAEAGPHRYKEYQNLPANFPSDLRAPSNTEPERDLNLQLVQHLYRGGQTAANVRGARADYYADRARTASVEQSLILDVGTSYWDVWQADAVVERDIEDERTIEQERTGAVQRFAGGALSRTDVALAEARLADATAARRQSEAELRAAAAKYEQLVGHAPAKLLAPGDDIVQTPQDLADAERRLDTHNFAILAAQLDEDKALAGIAAARGQLFPTVDLVVQAGRHDNALLQTPVLQNPRRIDDVSALLQVSVPLFTGAAYPELRAARAAYQQAYYTLLQTHDSELGKFRAEWETLASCAQVGEARRRHVQNQQLVVTGMRAEVAGGTRTLLDVLNADHDLVSAQVDAIKTEHDCGVARLQAAAAVGDLTAAALGLGADGLGTNGLE